MSKNLFYSPQSLVSHHDLMLKLQHFEFILLCKFLYLFISIFLYCLRWSKKRPAIGNETIPSEKYILLFSWENGQTDFYLRFSSSFYYLNPAVCFEPSFQVLIFYFPHILAKKVSYLRTFQNSFQLCICVRLYASYLNRYLCNSCGIASDSH